MKYSSRLLNIIEVNSSVCLCAYGCWNVFETLTANKSGEAASFCLAVVVCLMNELKIDSWKWISTPCRAKTTESTKMNELNYKTRVMVRINAREWQPMGGNSSAQFSVCQEICDNCATVFVVVVLFLAWQTTILACSFFLLFSLFFRFVCFSYSCK